MAADGLLSREIDDLLLHVRGLALVRELLARRGATIAELDAHDRELERLRNELAAALGRLARLRNDPDVRPG